MFHNLRTLTIICFTITEIGFLAACRSSVNYAKKNDTTAVLQILLDSVFYKHRLAAKAQLDTSKALTDTIIFKRNDILTHHLPKNLPHKLLTEDEMCQLMATHKWSNLQFLELDDFVKISNGYHTALGTHCMWRGVEETEPDETPHSVCKREKYCNVVLNMDVTKKGNIFTGSKFTLFTY